LLDTRDQPVLVAHLDVVEAKREDWKRDPFTLVEENGTFYARGALDDKAMASALVANLILYKQEGFSPDRDLVLALTADEVAQMRTVVARLARKIKDALALRQRQEQKGRIDSRRTIRNSLQYGGIPMEVILRRRHREKPKLVTICDVSDSVRNASRFMLQLVWSLQECFSRVRSYAFVSEIAEVTQAFNTYPVERAIGWALKAAPIDYHCRSDFGYAFSRFVRTELESLDRKTTILVLGDARNNRHQSQDWVLRELSARARHVFIAMEQLTRSGRPRLVERCAIPVTARGVVDLVITNYGLFAITPHGMEIREIAPGITLDEVRATTGCTLHVPPEVPIVRGAG